MTLAKSLPHTLYCVVMCWKCLVCSGCTTGRPGMRSKWQKTGCCSIFLQSALVWSMLTKTHCNATDAGTARTSGDPSPSKRTKMRPNCTLMCSARFLVCFHSGSNRYGHMLRSRNLYKVIKATLCGVVPKDSAEKLRITSRPDES